MNKTQETCPTASQTIGIFLNENKKLGGRSATIFPSQTTSLEKVQIRKLAFKEEVSVNNFQNKWMTHKAQTWHRPIGWGTITFSILGPQSLPRIARNGGLPPPSPMAARRQLDSLSDSFRDDLQASPRTCPHNRFLERVLRDLQLQAYY